MFQLPNNTKLKFTTFVLPLVAFVLCSFSQCTKDVGRMPAKDQPHRYPDAIASIVRTKCAVSGCHNSKSKQAAAGLSLETRDQLFEGSRGGASVIPYRPDHSTLMFYTNSFEEFGRIQLSPKMPLNKTPLSKAEVKTLFDWITSGAPNNEGQVMFSGDPLRKKFYVANQGCDVVTVFDARSMLAMRYIDVGMTRGIEAPHMVRIAPNNQHWYASFIAGGFFQKFRVVDDSLIASINLGFGSWNTFAISSDSQKAYVIDWNMPGKIAEVDLSAMTFKLHFGFSYPHGSIMKDDQTLYVTSQTGNYIYKIDVTDFQNPSKITLDNSPTPSDEPSLDPHEILFAPDRSKYFVTCQGSNEVRIMSAADSLIAVIPTGEFPQEMALSESKPYLFVTCMDDTTSNELERSSVLIIDYNTHKIVKQVYGGYQSHGLAVDDLNGRVYISNRNIYATGPQPHHQGLCSGRNGYITAIDLNTLSIVPGFKCEVSVDPYGMGIMR